MSELPRRQRRPISSSGSAAVAAPAPPTPAGGYLDPFLQSLRDVARMKQYRILGRLARMQIVRESGAKVIDFRKSGPVLGMAIGSDQLIVESAWEGLPPRWDETEEFCSACLATCDVCNGTGKKVCEGPMCGGSGRIKKPYGPCPADDCLAGGQDLARRPKADCAKCKGTGHYAELAECPVCKGSKQMDCPPCRGKGKRPTGNEGGSLDWRTPSCSSCQGSKFAHKEIPQEISEYVNARVGPMVALGPIVRFAVESVGGAGTPPQVYDVDADSNGQYMVLLLEREELGASAFMIGGVLRAVTRA